MKFIVNGRKILQRSHQYKLYKPFSSTRSAILELDDVIYRRSNLSTNEILEKLHQIDGQHSGIILPLRYYQNSIDVCAHRGDIDSATLVLRLAEINMKTENLSQNINSHADTPYLDLHWYTIIKFTAYGYFHLTSSLWKIAIESEPKYLKDNLNQVVEKIFTKQFLNSLESLEQIQQLCRVHCLNENSQFYQALSNTMDRYLTRRLHESNPPKVENEFMKLEHFSHEIVSNTSSQAHQNSLHLFKSRYLLGLCSLSRIQSHVKRHEINQFYQQAYEEFDLALKLSPFSTSSSSSSSASSSAASSASSSTSLQIESNRSDSGDVVKETLERKPKYNLGKTQIEFQLIEILRNQLTDLSNHLASPTEAGSYQFKQSFPQLTSTHGLLLEQRLPNSGAEGGNYRMNFEVETHRSVMVHLMNEMPQHVHSINPILDQLQSYLTRYYSHLLPEKTSRPSPPLIPLPYSDSEIHTPPVYSHILLRNLYSLARAHSQRMNNSTTRPINPLKTSDQYYLRNLMNQVIFSARYLRLHITNSHENEDEDDQEELQTRQQVHGEDEDGGNLIDFTQMKPLYLSDRSLIIPGSRYSNYFQLHESYGERLVDLSERSGIQLDAYFYANWIHSAPLCKLDHTYPSPWIYTTKDFIQKIIKRGVANIQYHDLSDLTKKQQIDILNHALICHICNYGDVAAIEYAYQTASSLYGKSIPVDIWNTLLTTVALNCPGKVVQEFINLAEVQCVQNLQIPQSDHHVNYLKSLKRGHEDEEISHTDGEPDREPDGEPDRELTTSSIIQLIQSKYLGSDQESSLISLSFDTNLGKALLHCYFVTKNKYESLHLMKALQYHGYRSPLSLYRRLIKCLLFVKEDGVNVIDQLIFSRPDITVPVIYEMMCRDGIRFDSTVLALLGELFSSQAKYTSNNTQLVTEARDFLIHCCLTHHLTPNEHILKVLFDICTKNDVGGGVDVGRGAGSDSDALLTQLLSLIDQYNEQILPDPSSSSSSSSKKRSLLIPTLPMLNLIPSSPHHGNEGFSNTQLPITTEILEKWIEIWAESEDNSNNFEEVIHDFSQRHGILPTIRGIKRLLAKQIKSKNTLAANKIGTIYLLVSHEIEKKTKISYQETDNTTLIPPTQVSVVHEELQQLFHGCEIPFNIPPLGQQQQMESSASTSSLTKQNRGSR